MLSQSAKEKLGKVVKKNNFGFAGLWIVAVTSAVAAYITTSFYYAPPIYLTIIFSSIILVSIVLVFIFRSKKNKILLENIENNSNYLIVEDFKLASLRGMAAVQYTDENGHEKKAPLPTAYSNQFLTKKQFFENSQLKKVIIVKLSDKKAVAIDYETVMWSE